jgi:hypothetical protein
MAHRLRILVSGMVAGDPHQGGAVWAVLQYVLGLRNLGHDVYIVEPIAPVSIRPAGRSLSTSINARYFQEVVTRFDLVDRAALLRQDTHETVGLRYENLVTATRNIDLLLNISGMLTDQRLFEAVPRRAYLDLDPAFNQLWHAVEGIDVRFGGHTHFLTVGCAIGRPSCAVPTCGLTWLPTLQPIVLSEWPVTAGDPTAPWTTIGNWRGYGSIQHAGVHYGQKAHSVRRLMDLPRLTRAHLRPALSIHPAEVNDLQALRNSGWDLVDPANVAATPDDYRTFIQHSKGELGIAKSGYVVSRCGWFSDRSVCYLASGRPVVAQDTGFSDYLPTGAGLFAFNTTQDVLDALEMVSVDYHTHCARARDIAEAYFSADLVLGALLDGVASSYQSRTQPREVVGARDDRDAQRSRSRG